MSFVFIPIWWLVIKAVGLYSTSVKWGFRKSDILLKKRKEQGTLCWEIVAHWPLFRVIICFSVISASVDIGDKIWESEIWANLLVFAFGVMLILNWPLTRCIIFVTIIISYVGLGPTEKKVEYHSLYNLIALGLGVIFGSYYKRKNRLWWERNNATSNYLGTAIGFYAKHNMR